MPDMPSTSTGLTSAEAARRLDQVGPNRLPEPKLPGPAAIFLRQFRNPFIYILLVAAVVALAVGQLPSAIFIVAVLLLNAVIGTVQEYSAQKSASALRRMVRGTTHVVRDGVAQTIDLEALVPGDLVLLASGDKVPADIRLSTSQSLAVDESMLTGESLVVTKNADATPADDAPLAERFDMCFAGSIITHGRGRGVVTATGLATELGSISKVVGAERLSEPPLLIRIRKFTYRVAVGILGAIALLVLLMLLKGGYDGREIALMSIGLAVSAIPEGLPAALTVALAIGMARMAERHVIIRKLIAVEALGSCTFICSDKTGTLTVNELTIRKVVFPGGTECATTGEGVAPGTIETHGREERLREICVTGVLANESYLDYSGGEWVSDGDIVDVAFLVLAKKLGLSVSEIRERERQLDLIPYESERALSGSLTRGDDDGHACLHVKGSPEKMLALSTHMRTEAGRVEIDRDALTKQFEALAADGYRVIALARREALQPDSDDPEALDHLEALTFLGLVAMIDPVRGDATEAVKRCRAGGIEVAMVTGDHPATARAIARELDLIGPDDPVVTGADIRAAAPEDLAALIRPARVFARIEPLQKQTIVETFMADGHFVAVTGDGVNDAPAMRRANAAVAMGKRGTDVAKEAADLIITDDRFSSIVAGVEQGRIVYNNIRKVIALLIATGASALILFFLSVLAGLPMPLTAVQLLWLNLVANGLQDVALAFEPKEGGELARRPRRPDEPIFESRIISHVLIAGGAMGLLAFAVFFWLNATGVGESEARNLTLMLMVLFGNIHALSSRSETRSLFRIPLLANPFLVLAVPGAQLVHIAAMYTPWISDVLAIEPIGLAEWAGLAAVALLLLAVEEGHKAHLRRREKREAT